MQRQTFLAAAAAATVIPARGRAAEAAVIRTGNLPTDIAAVINYAQDLGYYKSAGLDVQIEFMNSGPVMATAVTGGALDVGAINVGTLATARSRGVPLRFFAPAGEATATSKNDVIMVRHDSSIEKAADLNGKTVAIVAVKTMQHAAVLLWIDKNGGDSKSVKFIEVPFPEMLGALEASRVDAAITGEPFTTIGRASNRILSGCYSAMQLPFLIFGIFATDAWLDAHADQAQKFAAAIRQAGAWANTHPREAADLLTRFTKVDPQVAARMGHSVYSTTLTPALIQPVIDVVVRYGFLDKALDPNDLIWHPK